METNPILVESRPFQKEIHTEIIQSVRNGLTAVVVDSPTGSGKTYMGLSACRDLIENVLPELHPGIKPEEIGVAWVAMRSNLLRATENINRLYHLDGEEPLSRPFCPNLNTVSMFQRDSKHLRKYKIRIMVVDEAHHDTTESMSRVYGDVDPQYCIGLTATPFRTDHNRLGFQRVIKKYGYRYLIDQGYLAGFNHWTINEKWTPESVVGTYLESPDAWGSSVMFFLNREDCEQAHSLLQAGGIRSTVVHGDSDREAQIAALEQGELDVVISMAILAEGFDFPGLQSVFVRDSGSKGLVIQMAGRALRKFTMPDGTQKVANIVQGVNAKYPFTRFARARNQYTKRVDRWVSIKPNDNLQRHIEHTIKELSISQAFHESPLLSKIRDSRKKKRVWKDPEAPKPKKSKPKP